MFTGLYTSNHGAHAGTKEFDPPFPPLAERFAESGYRTAAFSNNTWLSPSFGFARGFESFLTRWELFDGGSDLASVAKSDGVYEKFQTLFRTLADREAPLTVANFLYAASLRYRSTEDSGGKRTSDRVIDWLDSDGRRPFFGFINYVEPHLQYNPPTEYRELFLPEGMSLKRLDRVEQDPWGYIAGEVEMNSQDFEALLALYRAELRYLDDQISRIYDQLKRKGTLDETVFIIVGDHGENIGDHDLMDHQYCLYDTLLHVPCIIRYPEVFDSGNKITRLVELRDLFPTLIELANLTSPNHPRASQNSLVYPTKRSIGREYAISEYLSPQPSMDALREELGMDLPGSVTKYDRALRAIRTKQWKYIQGSDGNEELYNISKDPTESDNVIDTYAEISKELCAILNKENGSLTSPVDSANIDADSITKERLKDLGYL